MTLNLQLADRRSKTATLVLEGFAGTEAVTFHRHSSILLWLHSCFPTSPETLARNGSQTFDPRARRIRRDY